MRCDTLSHDTRAVVMLMRDVRPLRTPVPRRRGLAATKCIQYNMYLRTAKPGRRRRRAALLALADSADTSCHAITIEARSLR